MKTKKMESVLQFVDKNMKFKSEFRGRRRVTSKRTSMSKTVKRKNNLNNKKIIKNRANMVKKNKKMETESEGVEKHPDGFIKLRCGPKLQENDFTCYSNESLIKLKELWNARHPDVMITTNDPREIWQSLKKYLKNVCNKESCWLKQNFASTGVDKEMLNYTFAPKSPDDWKKNPNEWLNSIDIENVMKQYEKEYPYFDFIGAAPIDFDSPKMYGECVWEELCHFDLNISIRNGRNKIGFVFNTDPHYLSGSHWISMFVNIKEQYSLFMIINLLKGTKRPEDFINDTFPDEEMHNFRHEYFNSEL